MVNSSLKHGEGSIPGHGSPTFSRSTTAAPLHLSATTNAERLRHEFEAGARFLGLTEIRPAQWVIADAVNAADEDGDPLWKTVGICIPRRVGKTVALWCIIFGRMLERPGYRVAFTAQTGLEARERFMLDVVDRLALLYDMDDVKSLPFKVDRSAGASSLRLKNGSILQIKPPLENSFRGNAYDLVVIDEAQRFSVDASHMLMLGAGPTMFGRPGAQLLVTGTAGEQRAGVLWDTLQQGRDETPSAGIVEYAAPDDTTAWEDGDEEVEGTTRDPALWAEVHPSIGHGVTLADLQVELDRYGQAVFDREYLGLWPVGAGGGRLITYQVWEDARLPGSAPRVPETFSLAFAAHHDGLCASIVAVWAEEDGTARMSILAAKRGTRWLADELLRITEKYKVPIIYDSASDAAKLTVEMLQRAKPRPQLVPLATRDVRIAASGLLAGLKDGNLKHFSQPQLDDAAALVTKRTSGYTGGWYLGRLQNADDISPLEAAALAYQELRNARPKRTAYSRVITD
ncbi:MAG: hypothetical protein ACTHMQ_05320 [Protaetiibacter sp.]